MKAVVLATLKALAIWLAVVATFTVVMLIWAWTETDRGTPVAGMGPTFVWLLGMLILVPVGVLTVVVAAVRAVLRGRRGSAPGDPQGADLDTKI